ncbi:zinc ribbon domain-containing protein [Pyrobaculum aerophilum]|uniref:Transposase n=1 Tax=Pyrobaculum aerophilum TaxID=13773 RepID=A0A371QW46_9CREN|nr:zinc ribbon domain-containing protein [Pyrobaculum aerophilum]RFA94509.1 transposase [Pyrobaculum aerophilum]RFA99205.1 transposase [Pyrobaculum aerophilum]
MREYRTLLIRRNVEEIPPEQLVKFLEVQQKFREWATQWYKSGFKEPMPTESPLKYFARELKFALRLLLTNGLKNGVWKVPLPFNAQLRVNNERDQSRGVFVDLPKGEIRIRKWGGVIKIRLRKSEIKWILKRLREGAQLKLVFAWVGSRTNLVTFNVALAFARETEPYLPERVLAIDLNALHNGVVWAIVDRERVLRKGIYRPDLGKIGRIQREISSLDSLCAKKGEPYCKKANELKSRLWRLLRQFEDEVAKKLVVSAMRRKCTIVVDVPEDESVRELKEGRYSPDRKIFLNIGRLRRRIRQLAEWYGVPYREDRLYSTACPRCGSKMEELPGRRVRCHCGFEAPRDEVPIMWAIKRFSELVQPPSFSSVLLPIPAL